MKCWADILGNCSGKQSGEHYITRALAEEKPVKIQGLSFCPQYREIPLSSARANILCESHNNALSKVDEAALQIKQALFSITTKKELCAPEELWRGPEIHHASGALFSRWLTKTYCNMMAIERLSIDAHFIRHSFGLSTERTMRTYLVDPRGVHASARDPHANVYGCHFGGPDGLAGVLTCFFDTHWVASDFDCTERAEIIADGGEIRVETCWLRERPEEVSFSLPIGDGIAPVILRLKLEW